MLTIEFRKVEQWAISEQKQGKRRKKVAVAESKSMRLLLWN